MGQPGFFSIGPWVEQQLKVAEDEETARGQAARADAQRWSTAAPAGGELAVRQEMDRRVRERLEAGRRRLAARRREAA
jgi:hypothetical protein